MVASQFFTAQDREEISKAVAAAEKGTAGEIVPVVANASDRYERAEDTFGIWLAILAVTVAWVVDQGVRQVEEDWTTRWELALKLAPILVLFVAGWIVGVRLAARFPLLKRLAASRRLMRIRVEERAEDSFRMFHVRRTKAATGIVIYVSLFERMVCVRADRAIAEKVDPSEWRAVCEGMMRAMREGRHREGFVEAIRKSGELLAKHFPIMPGDVNELPNQLRIID